MFSSGNSTSSRGSVLSGVSGVTGKSTMSKQFFKEFRHCKCCKGFIYGCEGVSCKSLGHCVCTTMDTGKALGSVRKYGKYEIIKSPDQLPHPETWVILWFQHFRRCYFGTFMDRKLASHAERKYLGKQLGMDPSESSEAFSLLAWRKSVLYVLFVLSVLICFMDGYQVYKQTIYWGYLGEMIEAPLYHGISSMPPYNLEEGYMATEAREQYKLPSPDSWTSLTGHVRDVETNLCLGVDGIFVDSDSAPVGSNIVLKTCTAGNDVQWLKGSDQGTYDYEKQLKLNKAIAYASVDPYTPAPTPSPTLGATWRKTDYSCGYGVAPTSAEDYPSGDMEVTCNPEDEAHKCCSFQGKTCGSGPGYCPDTDGVSSTCPGGSDWCCDYSVTGSCPNPAGRRTEVEDSSSIITEHFIEPDEYVRSLSSREPGVSVSLLTDPIGICLNVLPNANSDGAMQVNTDLCTSTPQQGFNVDARGFISSEQFGMCLAVQSSSGYPSVSSGFPRVYLAPCTSSNYVPIRFELPDNKKLSLVDLTPSNRVNAANFSKDIECSFLSQPKSNNWWPVFANVDNHKTCIKFSSTSEDFDSSGNIVSKVSYKVGGLGFSRFQAHVGMANTGNSTKDLGPVDFIVNLCISEGDCQTATRVHCEGETLQYGDSSSNLTQTPVTRNYCQFVDCDPSTIQDALSSIAAEDASRLCKAPYQAMDVVIGDHDIVELITVTPKCGAEPPSTITVNGEEIQLDVVKDCDAREFASWASPTLANAVRSGEEGLLDYTVRMLWGMHATIFEPPWGIFLFMDAAIMLIDMVCTVFIFWSLWYWAAYKRSRAKLFLVWALTFVGPLIISCIPVRLFIPWDNAEGHITAYLADLDKRYNLNTAEDMVLETCRAYTAGYTESTIDSLVLSITTMCAKKEIVPITCDKKANSGLADPPCEGNGACCHNFWKDGGILQWAEEVIYPDVNDAQYADFIYVSPSKQVIEGFPSTCFDIFNAGSTFVDACGSTSATFENFGKITQDNVLPCAGLVKEVNAEGDVKFHCSSADSNNKCELGGFCKMDNGRGDFISVRCTELYQYMNCTDIQQYYSDSCDCSCVQSFDNPTWAPSDDPSVPTPAIPSGDLEAPDWYYNNEWCTDGLVEKAVPKANLGNVWIPFKGNVPFNTFPTHMDCGKIRGMLFEAKFEQAAEELRVMCTKLLDQFGSDDVTFMDRVMQGVEDLLGYAQQMAGITTSMYNAFNMFRLALPVALCIGPALLRGALRTKLLVPQSATPGLFIQLLPWLYCPVMWCLFNFIFQLIGNVWLLPGLLLLSWIPMAYFIVGVRQEISKPMTKQTINLVIFWLDIFTGIASVIAWALLVYGGYYTAFEDPNSQMIGILVREFGGEKPDMEVLLPIILVIVFTILKVIFKYTATTVSGVDFMMYELIQQRFYEMFLEKGDATAAKLQEARANRLDAFCKLIATSTSQQMSRSTTKGPSKARKSMKKGKSRKSMKSRNSSMTRNGSDSEYSTRESSFASKVDNDTSHLVGPASIGAVYKKRASVWDMINNGQPRLLQLPVNTWNAIKTTPLHLRRSRSKLEIVNKLASRSEVAYLSKKFGLSHTSDSAICYELMVWRRSALWTLILVGSVATWFAIKQIQTDYLNAQAYYDLATSGVLHRFPKPGYLDDYTLEHFGLEDPGDWTIYSGSMKANVSDDRINPELRGEFIFSLSGGSLSQAGEQLGLVKSKEYEYNKLYQQWSFNPTNNTIMNEENFCLDVDKTTRLGGNDYMVVTNGCVNDFVRDKQGINSAIRPEQKWFYDEDLRRFRNAAGQCLGYYAAAIPYNHDQYQGEYRCGPKNPLLNGDPGQCPPNEADFACCSEETTGVYEWIQDQLFDTASTCGPCTTDCAINPNCKDYSSGNKDLTNIPMVATSCSASHVLEVELPTDKSVQDRLDSWCNDETICRFANASKMYALFDYGMNYAAGENDIRWRCYAEQTTKIIPTSNGKDYRVYDKDKAGAKYCDKVHTSITALMEKAQGREEFRTYLKRMVKVGYARMMAEAESAMISINALLIFLAWAAIMLAYLGFHLYSRYMLSRTLVTMGWFCTFLAPFLLSMIPLRLFIRWQKSVPVQDAMLLEFNDHYGLQSKEAAILETCMALEEDASVESLVDMTLDMCAYTKTVDTAVAYSWGDIDMADPNNSEKVDYECTTDLMGCDKPPYVGDKAPVGLDGGPFPTSYPYNYPYCIAGQKGVGEKGGYPMVPKNPCKKINAGNGQAWIDKGTYVCNNREDCDCPEDQEEPCKAMEEQEGVDLTLDEWRAKCNNEQSEVIPPIYYNGYIPLFFMSTSQGEAGEEVDVPITLQQEMSWPASIWVSNVAFDVTELLVQCGQARRHICNGDVYKALATAKAVCKEIRGWLDEDVGTDAQNIEDVTEYLMLAIKESSEIGISLIHSIKSFKIMASATFALAPALIRAAIRVKTAVPQNTISGMFVIVLPWLYSPLVWCIYNLVFQVIGNAQLLVGIIIVAYGPVLFFMVGVWKDITRPMPDKEIHIIRLMMTIIGRAKIVFGSFFIGWGLWVYAFEEQSEYTNGYKDYLLKDFSKMAMLELGASMLMKYYYTTIVGVDYMLNQILGSRRYEVYMQMSSQDSMWANSKAAKRAADLKEHYVHLMNSFCHMAGLSTADLPAFANYKAHKLKKKRREKLKAQRRLKKGKTGFFSMLFSRPPDRSEGVPQISMEMTSVAEDDPRDGSHDSRGLRSASAFEQENPLSRNKKKKGDKKKKKKEDEKEEETTEESKGDPEENTNGGGGGWQEAVDPESGKRYRYNANTGVTEWIDEGESESNIGAALKKSDDELIAMLRKPPKEVEQLHSRDAFRKFFNGFPAGRIEGLLREANAGKSEEEIEKKVQKRMKLLDGVLS